jgi:hypothetical protein
MPAGRHLAQRDDERAERQSMTEQSGGAHAAESAPAAPPQVGMLYRRVLGGDAGLAQVWFTSNVLDKYRSTSGFRVLRTNSAGRLRAPGGWTLDFGIAADDRLIHVSAADLAQRLPAGDKAHWLAHVATLPVSGTFLVMRLGAGHCMDDGDVRDWPG